MIGEADNGAATLDQIAGKHPDLVLVAFTVEQAANLQADCQSAKLLT